MACLLIGGAIYLGDRLNTSRKDRKDRKAIKLAAAVASSSSSSSSSSSIAFPDEEKKKKKQHMTTKLQTTYPTAAVDEKAALERRDASERKEASVGVHPALRRRGSAGSDGTRVGGEEDDADERTLYEEVRDVSVHGQSVAQRADPVRGMQWRA